jgi:hypothetical protein
MAHRVSDRWNFAPPITVVVAPSDLPIPAPDDARGLYYRGEVFVVAGRQLVADVGQTVIHEAIGHHAMRAMLRGSWRSFMFGIQAGARAGDPALRMLRCGVRETYVDGSGTCNLSPVMESDEIAAACAEIGFNPRSGVIEAAHPVRAQAAAVAGHVARESLYMDRPVSYRQLQGALLAAQHRIRYGDAFFGVGCRLRQWYRSTTMAKFNIHKPPMSLSESQGLLDAEEKRRNSHGETLVVLQVIGVLAMIALFIVLSFYGVVEVSQTFSRLFHR